MNKPLVYKDECLLIGLDPKHVHRIANKIHKAVREANDLGLYLMGIAVAAVVFGGCTPPAITVQQETTEKVAFDFLAEEKFYNCEAKTWVLPFGGPKDSLTLEVLQPGKGWKPVTDFGLAAWWKTGEVQVVDIKDRLAAFGCVMWRIMDRNFEYTVEVKK